MIPGTGNAINASITYTLHQLEGRALIKLLEKYGDDFPDMSQLDLITKLNQGITSGIDLIENDTVRKALKKALDFFV